MHFKVEQILSIYFHVTPHSKTQHDDLATIQYPRSHLKFYHCLDQVTPLDKLGESELDHELQDRSKASIIS